MNLAVTGSRRTRSIAAVVLVVVFSSGALGATALTNLSPTEEESAGSVAEGTGWLEALDLSEEQRDGIKGILDTQQPVADSIVRAAIQELRSLMTSADAEVRAMLSPAQLIAYEDLRTGSPQIQAVRRTMSPQGDTIQIDTVRIEGRP